MRRIWLWSVALGLSHVLGGCEAAGTGSGNAEDRDDVGGVDEDTDVPDTDGSDGSTDDGTASDGDDGQSDAGEFDADAGSGDGPDADDAGDGVDAVDGPDAEADSDDGDAGAGDAGDAGDAPDGDAGDGGPSDVDSGADAVVDDADAGADAPDTTPPFCPDGTPCAANTLCCEGGDLCLGNVCVTPAGDCLDSFDCPLDYFCEPALGQCLPQPAELTCTVVPDFEAVQAEVEWSWTDEQIISIPVVADLEQDGVPDVVVNLTRTGAADWEVGEMMALDGRTGAVKWRVPHTPSAGRWGTQGRSTAAAGDVSGDGLPDVVYASREVSGRSLIVAVNHAGEPLWTSRTPAGAEVRVTVDNGAVTLANFDADPMAEVVVGAMLLDHDGTVVWNQDGNGPGFGTNSGYVGGISVVVDLDGDGSPEIVTGRHAWRVVWTAGPPASATVTAYWDSGEPDGYPAVADLDLDGTPEVVLVGSRRLVVLEGTTGRRWCGRGVCASDAERTGFLLLPGGSTDNRGGPPTIADFDNDGRPEIGIAGGFAYTVYDIARPGEDIVVPAGDPAPGPGALYARWSQTTRDRSSNATGSSVFDFQGDGAAEVVYADECAMRVYDGATGAVILQEENSSATIHEYPIVVDVDADGNSEILIVANDASGVNGCGTGFSTRRGLFVYGDPGNAWVRTRRVWPQHAYHVTNSTSSGNVPLEETPHWTVEGLNAYRQNVQGEGVFNAPDLSVAVTLDNDRCILGELVVEVAITNQGTLGVLPGVPVQVFEGDSAAGILVGEATTPTAVFPGETVVVRVAIPLPEDEDGTLYVTVDEASVSGGAIVECDESNNSGAVSLLEACGT